MRYSAIYSGETKGHLHMDRMSGVIRCLPFVGSTTKSETFYRIGGQLGQSYHGTL